jgi:hypothetical protein
MDVYAGIPAVQQKAVHLYRIAAKQGHMHSLTSSPPGGPKMEVGLQACTPGMSMVLLHACLGDLLAACLPGGETALIAGPTKDGAAGTGGPSADEATGTGTGTGAEQQQKAVLPVRVVINTGRCRKREQGTMVRDSVNTLLSLLGSPFKPSSNLTATLSSSSSSAIVAATAAATADAGDAASSAAAAAGQAAAGDGALPPQGAVTALEAVASKAGGEAEEAGMAAATAGTGVEADAGSEAGDSKTASVSDAASQGGAAASSKGESSGSKGEKMNGRTSSTPVASGRLEAAGTALAEWLASEPVRKQLEGFLPQSSSSAVSPSSILDRDAVAKDEALQAECAAGFAEVVRFENAHNLSVQAMGESYLKVRE